MRDRRGYGQTAFLSSYDVAFTMTCSFIRHEKIGLSFGQKTTRNILVQLVNRLDSFQCGKVWLAAEVVGTGSCYGIDPLHSSFALGL
jgi:hypothetical protein